jgi:hexosaminidase
MEMHMDFYFSGAVSGLKKGIIEIAGELGVGISESADRSVVVVDITQKDGADIEISCKEGKAFITYDKKHHFFRAFGLMVEKFRKGEKTFSINETPKFTMNGPMFDVSQGNAVINVKSIKKFLRKLALMGMNMMMLYCEDSYDVDNQPYFGYMRSRYSEADLRDCDEYADLLGIELIPCIQTLAHLVDVLKWNGIYSSISEDNECLFVGEEKTYEFITDLIKAAVAPFKTKRIHIGMDEAWHLGRGSYLSKHGYTPTTEIMKIHLNRVMEIVRSLGLKPMMWSDMFFRSIGNGRYYQTDVEIPQHVIDSVPPEMQLVYWDYYHNDPQMYEKLILQHRKFSEPIFAGGIWTWIGFGPHWDRTFLSTEAALCTCKKLGIKEVFVTIWGDNGTEAPANVNMLGLSLYAEHGYCDTLDINRIKERFEFCTGAKYDDFMLLELLDNTPGVTSTADTSYNPSKFLMWQDILTGLFDKNIEGLPMAVHYSALAEKLKECIGRNGYFDDMFRFYYNVADTLALKSEMGLKITKAYKENDRTALLTFAENELPELKRRMQSLRDSHYRLWFDLYKAIGWDIFDMRYGSLIIRIDTAAREIIDYLEGRLERLEELEEKRLNYNGVEGVVQYANYFGRIVSASRIAPYC